MTIQRRSFVQSSAAAVPLFFQRSAHAVSSANDRLRVAAIGIGGNRGRDSRGSVVARQASRLGQMVAVCDVNSLRNEEWNNKFNGNLSTYVDYRELLDKEKPDVVTIGTPDHWHVPIAIAALKSGADVYCEKPLTLTIEEGKQICQVVRETGRVFQVGTQQRSEYGDKFLKAVALVQLGFLGDKVNADVAIGGAPKGGPFEITQTPDNLDWNMWLGPAPVVPYTDERRRAFRWFLEYSGGKITDWGAHHIDIATWAMGHSQTGPVKVSGQGQLPPCVPDKFDFERWFAGELQLPNAFNAAMNFHVKLQYADGSYMTVNDKYVSPDGKNSFPNGILLTGEKGRIFVNRGKLTGAPVENLTAADKKMVKDKVAELYGGERKGHMQNFFNCLKTRQQPISDVYTHHRTMTSCHLCNIALMLGRDLTWDPTAENFGNDAQANALMTRPQRAGFTM